MSNVENRMSKECPHDEVRTQTCHAGRRNLPRRSIQASSQNGIRHCLVGALRRGGWGAGEVSDTLRPSRPQLGVEMFLTHGVLDGLDRQSYKSVIYGIAGEEP